MVRHRVGRTGRGMRGAVSVWTVVVGLGVGVAAGLVAVALLAPVLRGSMGTEAQPTAPAGTPVLQPDGAGRVAVDPAARLAAPVVPPPVRLPALPGLQALLNEEAERMPGEVCIHVRVEGGAAGAGAGEAGVDAETPVPAASVIKLPIMVAVQNAWQTGFLTRTAVDELRMRSMITESDNPSADALIDRAGTSQINSWLLEHGYSGTSLRHKLGGPQREGPNLVTARDMTRMLLDIAGGRMIDANASAEMRRLLLDQTRRARIPAHSPATRPAGRSGSGRGRRSP